MNEFKLPHAMNEKEKETLLSQLENLIAQTYNVEKEYVALTASYNQLQSLVHQIIEALPNALWVLNEDGTIFLQNSEAKDLEGLIDRIDMDKREQEIAFDRHHYLVRLSRNDGKHIISATDITEHKRRERLASMGQMAAHLAHEIRNPIGSIALLVSSLAKRVAPKNQPIVEEIKQSIFRVERIIKTTLMYSKGVEPHFTKISLDALEKECRTAFDNYLYTKPINIMYEFDTCTIEGDFGLLSLTLQNLLFNAIDAIEESDKESGTIRIFAQKQENSIEFIIEDDGVPLPSSEKLFEAFHTTKTKGHGLGLALSDQIVQAHHGKIMAKTNPKRFIVSLPITPKKRA